MKSKKTLMRDVPVGSLVFTIAPTDDEIRETYYTKLTDDTYLHHGCIQGQAVLEDGERPRYHNVDFSKGGKYPLVPTLVVYDISESRFSAFHHG